MSSSPLQEIVLTSSPDGPISAYDAFSGATLARFTASRSPRKGLALVGKKLLAASHVSPDTGKGSIHLYNWWSSSTFLNLPVPEPVAPLAATLDGMYLFAGGISGCIYAFSLPAGDIIRSFSAHCKPISCLEINDDGSLLLSGSDDGTIAAFPIFMLLDTSSSNLKPSTFHRFGRHDSSVTSITTGIGGCNATLVSCSLDCTCKFWDLMYGTHLHTLTFPCAVLGMVMDPLESHFYVAGSDGLVYNGTLKVAARQRPAKRRHEPVWRQKHGGAVIAMAMLNVGKNLITASEDGSVWVWEVERGKVIKVLGEELGSISGLVVAKGFGDFGGLRVQMGGEIAEASQWRSRLGLSSKEVSRPIKEIMEMEELLNVVAQDRSRAITNLESAIGIYERLLELILKETKAGTKNDGSDEEKDDA
ncbi:hypothetical protein RJ639_041563 [Escallonia herrerae]|uniref:Protein ROOT INITIATION DEFECTIVE 3-like n=1 Tax=Escallonia herrerae TaxID=1293975 RepID=A0AA88WDA0_9ASTE|nr:hypothetical protein RJ639_041563 [Escallonia herrerae]